MSIVCCGVKYSKKDPDTYWCFESDILKPVQKKYVDRIKVIKETVDTITCKKCGALIVLITRYGTLRGKKKLLEKERLSGMRAFNYL